MQGRRMLVLLLAAVTGCVTVDKQPTDPTATERALQIIIEIRREVEHATTELERRAADRERAEVHASPSHTLHAGVSDDLRKAKALREIWIQVGRITNLIDIGELSEARLRLERLYWRLVREPENSSNPTYSRVIRAVQQQILEARDLLAGPQ
jgi:hypothetical protein